MDKAGPQGAQSGGGGGDGGGAGRREGAYGVGEGWGMRLDRKVEKLNIW